MGMDSNDVFGFGFGCWFSGFQKSDTGSGLNSTFHRSESSLDSGQPASNGSLDKTID